MTYPNAYHAACAFLIEYGTAPSNAGRSLMAHALRALRRTHGRAAARSERRHLLLIAGDWPAREVQP